MTKKIDETLKKTSNSAKKTNFKITKKNPAKVTKKVILETPILEQISDKRPKRTVVKKRPEHVKAVGSLNVVKKPEDFESLEIIEPLIVSVPPKAQKTGAKKVKKSHTSLKPVTPRKHSQKNSRMLNTQQILLKPKRNLKLHLENKITSDEEEQINSILNFENVPSFETSSLPKKEVSINQNAEFFYEPSIFERFNIEISNIDEKSSDIDTSIQNKDENSPIDIDSNKENLNEIETDNVITPNEENTSNDEFDFVSDTIPSELQNATVEDNSEYDFISTEVPNIYGSSIDDSVSNIEEVNKTVENNKSQELVTLNEAPTSSEDTNITDEKVVDIDDILDISDISLDDINLDDISLEDIENNLVETDFSNEEAIKEVADSILPDEILNSTEEKSDSKDSAIGKFFDSSIPNINNNDNSYFTKIKKSLFSNISTVFKKFSYEEASLVTSENETLEEEASPIINEAQKNNNSDILQVLGNFDNEETTIKNLEVSAEPNTLVIPAVDEKILEPQEITDNETQDIYTNVITPQTTNDVIEDVTLDNIEINDKDIPEIKTFVNSSNTEIEKQQEPQDSNNDLDELSEEELDKELDEVFGLTQEENNVEEEQFSIEEYFGVTPKQEPEENDDEYILEDDEDENLEEETSQNEQNSGVYQEQMQTFSKLIENFTQTISTLSNKISALEDNISSVQNQEPTISEETEVLNDSCDTSNQNIDDNTVTEIKNTNEDETEIEDNISLDDISLDDISLDDISLEDLESLEKQNDEEASLLPIQDENNEDVKSVEDILLEAFDNPNIDDQMKQDLLSEVLSVEEDLNPAVEDTSKQKPKTTTETEATSDFFKIIDSLSKTISELESEPEEVASVPEDTSNKAINILINKDDIFSIAITNETYEIVTDFDGISVLSENIHISTPKNNFYVNIGEKYIEIHKQPDLFVVNTNFEDIEFANAINNITFAKKKNKIELNIKEAFKISSVNKKIELSMLNTSIANLTGAQEKSDSDSSICDNKTLLINEETQKVYLPYTIEEVMKKLNNSSDYQSLEDVIEQEYTLPLSTFKMPIISRFKEAYKFMREKEKSSVYAALDLAVELMFNSNLNPAVIRASKDLKELNIYLDCLYENEIEKFDCFKIIYKVLPKIQS